jgi:hypothetical protein
VALLANDWYFSSILDQHHAFSIRTMFRCITFSSYQSYIEACSTLQITITIFNQIGLMFTELPNLSTTLTLN